SMRCTACRVSSPPATCARLRPARVRACRSTSGLTSTPLRRPRGRVDPTAIRTLHPGKLPRGRWLVSYPDTNLSRERPDYVSSRGKRQSRQGRQGQQGRQNQPLETVHKAPPKELSRWTSHLQPTP